MPSQYSLAITQLTKTSDPYGQLAGIQAYIEHYQSEYKTKLRENAFNNYSVFAEYLSIDEPPAYHHHYMCERLMELERGDILRLAFSLPAGGGKTEYASRRFAVWCMGRRKTKWLQAGHTAGFVKDELGKKTKAYVTTDEYKDVFDNVALLPDMRAGEKWGLTNKSEYVAKSVGSGIAGTRANMASIDDLYPSLEEALSPAYRDKAYNWYLADFTTRLLPKAPILIVNTRWHSDDLIGRLKNLSSEGSDSKIIPFEIINLKALSELGDDNDPLGRTEPEMSMWPDYYDAQHYITLRNTLTGSMFNSLYQGVPVDEEGGLVKGDWFQRYTTDVRNDPNITVRRIVISVDSAQKAQDRHDPTVITVWAESGIGHHYLLDVVREKLEFPEMCTLIDKTAERWNASAILVEDKGTGTSYIQTRQGKLSIPVIPISTNNNSKEFRFDKIAPMFEAGLVYLPKSAKWLAEYERELMAFPNGKFDDQVDSTSQYLDWARGKVRKGGTTKHRGNGSAPSSDQKRRQVEEAIEQEMERKRREREEKARAEAQRAAAETQPDSS